MKKKFFKGFLPIMMAIMLVIGVGTVAAFAEENDASAETVKYGWNVYSGTLDSTPNGMTFGSVKQGADYGFSATTDTTVKARELALNLRVRDNVYSDNANADIIIGLSSAKGDFTAAGAVGYGIILQPTAANTYNAWLIKPNAAATAVPGYDNITVITGVTLSESGTLSILFHREAADRWMVMMNGWAVDNQSSEGEAQAAANAAFEAMDDVYLSVASRDSRQGEGQTMKVELYQFDGKMAGTKKDTKAVFTNNLHNHEAAVDPEYTENGIIAKGSPELRMGVSDSLSGALDGYAMSVISEPGENTNYSIDLGLGTAHGTGRFTYWDSSNDKPGVAYSFGVRISSNNNITYLMLKGTGNPEIPGTAETFDGAISFAPRADGRITVALNKVGENWKVYVNGRETPAHNKPDDGPAFQTFLNETMDGMKNAAGVSPWIMSYVNNDPATEFKYTFTGYGTCPLGVLVDPNIGNVADEIKGELEFSGNQWNFSAAADTVSNLRITDEGFYVDGMARETGFAIGLCHNRNLASVDGFTATLKMPEKVKPSGGEIHGYYGMYIGSATNRNFADQDSVLIRFAFDTEDPTDGATVYMINWDKTNNNDNYADCNAKVAPKTEAGKEREYTIHIAYYEEAATYRIYVNGQRVSNLAMEEKITAAFDAMEQKYFYLNGSYEKPGGGAWVEGDNEPVQLTIVSINGNKIVNKVAEPVNNAFTLNDGEEITANSVKLTWTKGEYAAGAIDSYNFVPHHYIIERIKGDSEVPEATLTVDGNMDTLTYTDTGLDADTKYYYTVYAVDESGNNKLLRSNANKRVTTLKASGDNGGGDNNNGDNNGGDNNGGTSGGKNEKGCGCGSSAVGACGAAAAVLIAAAGFAIVSKKKHNA